MLIYLCARVAPDAQEDNEIVAKALEAKGIAVFVPHREDKNNPEASKNPFRRDFTMMQKADAVVIVGKIGIDCAAEIGWFAAKNTPKYYIGSEAQQAHIAASPMVNGFLPRPWYPDGTIHVQAHKLAAALGEQA